MAEYPKYFVRSGRLKKATSKRQEVELKFAGYREVAEGDVVSLTLDHGDPVTVAVLEEATTQKAPPELTEAEMAKLPEAADAEVVDLTDTTKPTEAELQANADEKAADPKAYLANQKKR